MRAGTYPITRPGASGAVQGGPALRSQAVDEPRGEAVDVARAEGIDERGSSRMIRAHVPLAEMFGYATELRSMTQGRATYSMEFSRYAEVPSSLANELIAKSKS